jgi:hypothetical protein
VRFNVAFTKPIKIQTMITNSTLELLTLHLYDETSETQRAELTKQIAQDEQIREDLTELSKTKRELNRKLLSPSATSVRIIMEHSLKTEHHHETC